MSNSKSSMPITKIDVARSTAAAAVTLAVVFFVCWAVAAVSDIRFPHMFMELFTLAPAQSGAALGEGLLWSTLTGACAGALASISYNLFAFLGRR